MSVVVVVKKGEKAVIAADTLFTGRTRVPHRYTPHRSKLVPVPGGFVGCVGTATNLLVVQSLVAREVPLDFTSTSAIFDTLLELQPRLKDEYFVRTDEDDNTQEYDSNQLDLLICNGHGIFGALSYREVCEYDRFWAHGSGSPEALGAMHAVYELLEDPAEIARAGVRAACEFDNRCGLPLELREVDLV